MKRHLECYTHVITSKPCQRAQTRELVSVRIARSIINFFAIIFNILIHYTCFQNVSHASAMISDTESTNMNAEAELNSPLVCYMILTVMWIIKMLSH